MDNLKKTKKDKIPLKCEVCDKEFKSNRGLKFHFNIIHNFEKEHRCNICQKVFHIRRKLTLHVKFVHENNKHHKLDLERTGNFRTSNLPNLQ